MKTFKDFGIEPAQQGLTGEKIKMDRILNTEIIVHDFRLEPSKFNGQCLHLQIEFKNEKRIVFSGSIGLLQDIQIIPKDGFPFKTTIIRENDYFKFT